VFLDEKLRLARCVAAPAADFKRKGGAGVSALTVGIVTAHVLKQVHMHLVHADCEAPRRAAISRYGAALVLELHVSVNRVASWPLSAVLLDDSRDTIVVQSRYVRALSLQF
jgi:hypothetical protein